VAVIALDCWRPAPAIPPGAGKKTPAPAKKFKIYWNLSLTSGGWIARPPTPSRPRATPPYDKMVDLEVVISGLDVQKQISDYESMLASRPDAIISMPFSATAVNRAVRAAATRAC